MTEAVWEATVLDEATNVKSTMRFVALTIDAALESAKTRQPTKTVVGLRRL